jgi:hypothetical protein
MFEGRRRKMKKLSGGNCLWFNRQ